MLYVLVSYVSGVWFWGFIMFRGILIGVGVCLFNFPWLLFGFFDFLLCAFVTYFRHYFELWFTMGLHFRTLLKPLGCIFTFFWDPWATILTLLVPLGPEVNNSIEKEHSHERVGSCLLKPFLVFFFEKREVYGECWIACSFFFILYGFSRFTELLDPRSEFPQHNRKHNNIWDHLGKPLAHFSISSVCFVGSHFNQHMIKAWVRSLTSLVASKELSAPSLWLNCRTATFVNSF
jgi:hypothetical protein